MKQQLSIFLISLLLINCSNAMNIRNNLLLANVAKNTVQNSASNFIDVKMLETCDEGILADIDFTNVLFVRIPLKTQYLEMPPNQTTFVNIPQFNTPVNLGENGKNLARLTVKFVIPGMRITINSNALQNYYCKLFFDNIDIGSYYYQQNVSTGDAMEDMIIYGTLFNIPPGLYIISLQCLNGSASRMIFGTSHINHQYIELTGEYSASLTASTLPKNLLLPVAPNLISRQKTKFIFAVNDILTSIRINQSTLTQNYYADSAEVTRCCNTKAFQILAAEGDIIQFTGSNSASSTRGMRVSINYFNNLGFPEILNTNYNNFSLDNLANSSSNQANIISANNPVEHAASYQPLDYTSSWIWNAGVSKSFAVATATLPRTNTKPVMFIQACTHLVEVKVNDTASTFNENMNKCEIVKTLRSPTHIKELVSGDKIAIKIKRDYANTAQNVNMKAYFQFNALTTRNEPYNLGFLLAVIAYKNKDGEVKIIKTGDKGWTCNNAAPLKVPIQANYRNEFYLTAAFEARGIYQNLAEYVCNVTLP